MSPLKNPQFWQTPATLTPQTPNAQILAQRGHYQTPAQTPTDILCLGWCLRIFCLFKVLYPLQTLIGIMPNPTSPRKLTSEQLKRLEAYISAEPILTHQTFLAKWDISRELTSEICRCEIRTINTWFAQGRIHRPPKEYHLWHLTFADIILERFDELPDFLQILLLSR